MSQQDRTRELVAGYLDAIASDEALAELSEAVTQGDEHADAFVEAAAMDGMLDLLTQDEQQLATCERLLAQLGWEQSLESPEEDVSIQTSLADSLSPGLRFSMATRHLATGIAVAVAFVVMSLSVMHQILLPVQVAKDDNVGTKQPAEIAANAESIARLVDSANAKWRQTAIDSPVADKAQRIKTGMRLYPGQKLFLSEGVAEFKFFNGAEVVLQGPAEIEIQGKKQCRLSYGKLVAKALEERAKGFIVETPMGNVEDLGTEFGVSVNSAGMADVVVFSGEVKVGWHGKPGSDGGSIELASGKAARILRHGTETLEADATANFVRAMPALVPAETVLAIDFNDREATGPDATQDGFEEFVADGKGASKTSYGTAIDTERQFGDYTVRIERVGGASLDDRRRDAPVDTEIFDQSALLRDFIFGPNQQGEALRIIISGLEPGQHYEGTLWSFDTGSPTDRTSMWLANRRMVAEAYVFDGKRLPQANSDYQMRFQRRATASGRIMIEGHHVASATEYSVYLNALRLRKLVHEQFSETN